MHKILWALAVTGALFVGAGWWFGWDFSKTFNIDKDFNNSISPTSVIESLGDFDESAAARWSSNFREIIDDNTVKVKESVDGAVAKQRDSALAVFDDTKNSFLDSAREQASALISSLSRNIDTLENSLTGSENNNSENYGVNFLDNLPFGLVAIVKARQPASFLIKNNNDIDIKYQIDWGDEKKADGVLHVAEEAIVSHAWEAAGDYVIKFTGKEFLVRVIE